MRPEGLGLLKEGHGIVPLPRKARVKGACVPGKAPQRVLDPVLHWLKQTRRWREKEQSPCGNGAPDITTGPP